MKKILQWIGIGTLVLVVVFGVLAFLGFNQAGKLRPSVEQFVGEFYAAMDSGEYRKVYEEMTTPEFRQTADYPQFERFAQGISEKIGKVQQRTAGPWQIFQGTGGLFFSIQYSTVRERGKGTEAFNLKRDGESWKVHSYNVNSPDLFRRDF